MAVCVRMVGQELRACVQYRPPLQCSRQRCTGPRRAVPQQPACLRAHQRPDSQSAAVPAIPPLHKSNFNREFHRNNILTWHYRKISVALLRSCF